MKIEQKKETEWKRNVVILLMVLAGFALLLLLVTGITVQAAGLVDETIDAGRLFSRYGIDNYQLDYYVDLTWAWLPWNWDEGVEGFILFNLYSITNGIWLISVVISNATGYVVQEAYKLDFINDMADSIGTNIQVLAGVNREGFLDEGFYPGFIMLVILAVGAYVAYVGLIKRETSRAIGAAVNMLIIFILSTCFIAYAPEYIRKINDFSSDISTGALTLGTKIVMPGSITGNSNPDEAVYLMRDSLFSVQVYQPWMILQYGTSNVEDIGEERVQSVLIMSPLNEFGEDRRKAVKSEIETYGNMNMTTTGVVKRFGMVFLILLLNLTISIFVFLLCGMMILSQIMFIIFVMFLPVSFVLSMFPTYNSMAKKAVIKVFNIILMRAGITLVVTIALSVSSMIYGMSSEYPFFLVAFLQIVVFAGIYMKLGELLEMISLQDDSGGRRRGSMMRSAARYLVMRKMFGKHHGVGGKRGKDSTNYNAERDYIDGDIKEGKPDNIRYTVGESKGSYRRSSRLIDGDSEEFLYGYWGRHPFRIAEESPKLRYGMQDGEVVQGQKLNIGGRTLDVYKNKGFTYSNIWDIEDNSFYGVPKSRVAMNTPELRHYYTEDGEVMTKQSIDVQKGAMDKYRGRKIYGVGDKEQLKIKGSPEVPHERTAIEDIPDNKDRIRKDDFEKLDMNRKHQETVAMEKTMEDKRETFSINHYGTEKRTSELATDMEEGQWYEQVKMPERQQVEKHRYGVERRGQQRDSFMQESLDSNIMESRTERRSFSFIKKDKKRTDTKKPDRGGNRG